MAQTLARLFSRRWWWVTLLVLAAMGVLARLGLWQLDRLEQRRAANARTTVQLASNPLLLDGTQPPEELTGLVDRRVTVRGRFDLERQFILLNATEDGQAGVRLFAPLLIDGSEQAILVDRGWLPETERAPAAWSQYDLDGARTVDGFLQKSIQPPRVTPDSYDNSIDAPQPEWYFAYIPAIRRQFPYEVLPVYVRQSPAPGDDGSTLPRRTDLTLDLSEGPHLGYAIQWFLFATVLGVGYFFFVRRQERDAA
jgi:surfeit locus 1 family protein